MIIMELSDHDKELILLTDDWFKRELGRFDIEMMVGVESEKFDRRKFGKWPCRFCNHSFNPFYVKSLKKRTEWIWRWQGLDYKQPEKDYQCNCPKCKEELFFTVYIGQ